MNLFTTYTKEETETLLKIGRKKSFAIKKIPLFQGVNINKLDHFEKKSIKKKEIIKDFEFIFVESGKIGVVKNGKIIKILTKYELFGILNLFLNEEYMLLALEESKIICFGIGEDIQIYRNLLEYVSTKIKGKVII